MKLCFSHLVTTIRCTETTQTITLSCGRECCLVHTSSVMGCCGLFRFSFREWLMCFPVFAVVFSRRIVDIAGNEAQGKCCGSIGQSLMAHASAKCLYSLSASILQNVGMRVGWWFDFCFTYSNQTTRSLNRLFGLRGSTVLVIVVLACTFFPLWVLSRPRLLRATFFDRCKCNFTPMWVRCFHMRIYVSLYLTTCWA